VSALLPAESLVMTVARAQIERGENPKINTTIVLLLTVDRLRAAVDDVLALHRPLPLDGRCRICIEEPCETVAALTPVADPDPHTTSDKETT
jgi:hypothetical protein